MGKASRTKRRRAVVRSAKRARNNNWWYGLTALIVIAGISLVVYARATAPSPVGPYVADQANPTNPHNRDSHWHAALGVYDCDHWLGDGGAGGPGTWNWPAATPTGSPARANNTGVYAGLHSHDDGIIHMEPAVNEEAGRHATVGKYFDFGGWDVSATSFDFLGTKRKNGDKCGNATGTIQWETAHYDNATAKAGPYTVRTGNPGSFKLHDDDVVVIAFLPPGKTLQSIGDPPSLVKLPDAASRETNSAPTPATAPPGSSTPSTAPTGTTTSPTTAKP